MKTHMSRFADVLDASGLESIALAIARTNPPHLPR
jgi:hypothetical protein